jgi:hypothetical protein
VADERDTEGEHTLGRKHFSRQIMNHATIRTSTSFKLAHKIHFTIHKRIINMPKSNGTVIQESAESIVISLQVGLTSWDRRCSLPNKCMLELPPGGTIKTCKYPIVFTLRCSIHKKHADYILWERFFDLQALFLLHS